MRIKFIKDSQETVIAEVDELRMVEVHYKTANNTFRPVGYVLSAYNNAKLVKHVELTEEEFDNFDETATFIDLTNYDDIGENEFAHIDIVYPHDTTQCCKNPRLFKDLNGLDVIVFEVFTGPNVIAFSLTDSMFDKIKEGIRTGRLFVDEDFEKNVKHYSTKKEFCDQRLFCLPLDVYENTPIHKV